MTNNTNIRRFVSHFQIYLRKNYPIFLLMSGLYENISDLQNEKTLTFLYRASKIRLNPLNIRRMAENYERTFEISTDEALQMAKLTKGYPYAFQMLGYCCYKDGLGYKDELRNFDIYMAEYVYDKIWRELSKTDQHTITAICKSKTGRALEVRTLAKQTSNFYNRYRIRLLEKEIIRESGYGCVELTLPRFTEYVEYKCGDI